MSIHADDEFNLRLALDGELDDVTPRAGLADLVIARYRKGRRRRFAGVVGLFVIRTADLMTHARTIGATRFR